MSRCSSNSSVPWVAPPPALSTKTPGAKMSGDLDGDGKPEAIIRLSPSEPGCDGWGNDHAYSIDLYFGKKQAELLCCGP